MSDYFIVEAAGASRGHMFLGVGESGLSFCDAEKNELKAYLYTDISSWAATKTNFAFTHGTFEDVGKFVFRTEEASSISDMVRQRVNGAYAKLIGE